MKHFSSTVDIAAPAEMIWAILTDAAAYPSWNSTVERIEGHIALGEKVSVYTKSDPARAFPLKVSEFEPGRKMIWSGGMPLGLFTGTRSYKLEPQKNGHVTFSMSEEFSGLLALLITRSIPDLQLAFETFAADLKRRAESRA